MTLVELVETPEKVGSEDMETDEKELTAARQLLILKAQKALAYYKRYANMYQEVKDDVLEQPEGHQQFLADILPSPLVPSCGEQHTTQGGA